MLSLYRQKYLDMANISEKSPYISREEKNGITQEYLKEILNYKDGLLYWKVKKAYNTIIDNRAGRENKIIGRNYIRINKKDYLNARIIFCYHHGYFPKEVDHINHNSIDDRIENLREANRSENNRNSSSRKNASSQYLGVSFVKKYKKWLVQICANGKQKRIGQFENEIEAALVYNREAVRYFREFASLNIIKL